MDRAVRSSGEAPGPPPEERGADGSGTVTPIQAREGEPAWPCPLCGNRNPIESSECIVCGTPFASLFAEPGSKTRLEPTEAAKWSLMLPGLGHVKSGLAMDGVARMILFAWTLGTLLVLLVSRFGKGGLGVTAPLVVLFLLGWLLVHAESVVDAYRVAAGEMPLVSSRALLWASVVLVLLSMLLGSILLLPAARGG
jgi:hypothetical protein